MRLLILFFISFNFLLAQVIINPEDKRVNNFTLFYYHDKNANKTIEDISKYSFTKKILNQSSLKYKKGSLWFKIEIKNRNESTKFLLKAYEVFYNVFNVYEYKDNKWKVHKNGLNIEFKKREIKDKLPVIPFEIKTNETKILYVEVSSFLPFMMDFEIFEYDEFFKYYDSRHDYLYMFFFGSLFIIILFNLFLFVTMKDIIYGYYVGYAFCFMLFVFAISGYTIDIGLQNWYHEFYSAAPFAIAFLALFTNEILNIKDYSLKLTKLLYFLVLLCLFLVVLIFIDIETWCEVLTIFSSISFTILFLSSIYAWIKGNINAKFYLVALSLYLVSMVIFTSMSNGWIQNNNFTRYAYFYASFIEIIIFSLMLASRFYRVNKEKLIAVNNLREKEKLLQDQSRLAQMGEMINMIAHQWRQPLGAINSALFIIDTKLKMKKFDLKKEKDRKDFLKFLENKQKNIYGYVEFLSTTIDDFRNFFKQDKQKQKFPLSTCVEKSLHIVKASLEDKNIKLFKNYEVQSEVFLYQNEIIQVILNILKNSEDSFIEKNIKDRKIEISTRKNNLEFYSICICDNAGGIKENIISKIFDPYFSTKAEKNGTGLGLYISKMIVEKHHGGKLNTYNHKDGVCFEIVLK